jgi:hypothetical protein
LIKVTKAKPKYTGAGTEFSEKLETARSASLKMDPFAKNKKKTKKNFEDDDGIYSD